MTFRWKTRYPAARVKARDLKPGDHYAARPLGRLQKIETGSQVSAWPYRLKLSDDVLRFDYEPHERSLFRELDVWRVHGSTGRALPRKRWSSNTVLHETRGIGGSSAIGVRLHETDVVTVNVDDLVTLRTGGWPTMLTSARIEDFLPEGWYIEKHGSELPWLLWTRAARECRCGSTDPETSEPCPADTWDGTHYHRAAHEIVMSEGMTVNLRTGLLVTAGDEIIMSWPKDSCSPRGWQAKSLI